jgi:hypothetical protein
VQPQPQSARIAAAQDSPAVLCTLSVLQALAGCCCHASFLPDCLCCNSPYIHHCYCIRLCCTAGSTFELLAVATSRTGVNRQVFLEEPNTQAVLLQQPATGLPLNTCNLPGVLSMQVVLEEGPAATAAVAGTQSGSGAAAAGAATVGTSAGAAASQAGQGEDGLPQLQLQLRSSGQLLSQSQDAEDD